MKILIAILGVLLMTSPVFAQVQTAKATFAGGCFWCMEPAFDKVEGVISTTSGYTGGTVENPTYEQVTAGDTGHFEAVEVVYDPARVSYETLLEVFWKNIDPMNRDGQFCDIGAQYRTAVFTHDAVQQAAAEASKLRHEEALETSIATRILPAGPFYKAEDYHQDYYLKNPLRYKVYREQCQRDRRLAQIWGAE